MTYDPEQAKAKAKLAALERKLAESEAALPARESLGLGGINDRKFSAREWMAVINKTLISRVAK